MSGVMDSVAAGRRSGLKGMAELFREGPEIAESALANLALRRFGVLHQPGAEMRGNLGDHGADRRPIGGPDAQQHEGHETLDHFEAGERIQDVGISDGHKQDSSGSGQDGDAVAIPKPKQGAAE